jgi:hypothetical protein
LVTARLSNFLPVVASQTFRRGYGLPTGVGAGHSLNPQARRLPSGLKVTGLSVTAPVRARIGYDAYRDEPQVP